MTQKEVGKRKRWSSPEKLGIVLAGCAAAKASARRCTTSGSGQHRPDVILLGIGMPRGYRIAQQLRQQPETRDALIIAVTGYGQESDRERSKHAGIDLHLIKPINSDELLSFLQGDPTLLLKSARR